MNVIDKQYDNIKVNKTLLSRNESIDCFKETSRAKRKSKFTGVSCEPTLL